jgi:LEA14-like dessication related protein
LETNLTLKQFYLMEPAKWWASLYLADAVQAAILFVLMVTALAALWSIRSQKVISKKRATIDLMMKMKQDPSMEGVYSILTRVNNNSTESMETFAYTNSDVCTIEAEKIRYLLNYYETISVGIKNGIYDESIIIDSRLSVMIMTFKFSRQYIAKVRELNKTSTAYVHFEERINKWRGKYPDKFKDW